MKNSYVRSLLNSTLSVLPMILLVMLMSIIPTGLGPMVPLGGMDYVALSIGTVVMIVGLALFQIGTDNGLAKVGEYMGSSLSKQSNLWIVIIFSFLLGALITCAEPSILVISTQVGINPLILIGVIAGGVGLFVVIGVIRIIFHGSLKLWYLLYYFIVFALLCLISVDDNMRQFLPFIFDAGGITTGSATVPFILALGAGIAAVRGGRKATDDSFGLVGMASIGPILSMVFLLLINRSGFSDYIVEEFGGFEFMSDIGRSVVLALLPQGTAHLGTLIEVVMAVVPIIAIFLVYNALFIKLPKEKLIQLLFGFGLVYFGLVFFLTGVNALISPYGTYVGRNLGKIDNNVIIVLIAFVVGIVTILCEPAVSVLTNQINNVSDGAVKKSTVMFSIAIGVGIAIALAVIRSIADFNILYIVVPGYILSLVFMFICPDIFTAMAFDAGGTASGPMSVSFVLPMVVGITYMKAGQIEESTMYYTRSFGVIALIALTPILAIQILGIIQLLKSKHRLRVASTDVEDPLDAEIIHFK